MPDGAAQAADLGTPPRLAELLPAVGEWGWEGTPSGDDDAHGTGQGVENVGQAYQDD